MVSATVAVTGGLGNCTEHEPPGTKAVDSTDVQHAISRMGTSTEAGRRSMTASGQGEGMR